MKRKYKLKVALVQSNVINCYLGLVESIDSLTKEVANNKMTSEEITSSLTRLKSRIHDHILDLAYLTKLR